MQVSVVFFARARDLAGADSIAIQLPQGATVSNLKSELQRQFPDLLPLLPHCSIAVDHQYSDDETELTEGSEVGCIPPVSGG